MPVSAFSFRRSALALSTPAGPVEAELLAGTLRAVAADAGDARADAPPPFRMERALVWERFAAGSDEPDAGEAAVLERLARDGAAWEAVAREALGRIAALEAVPEGAGDGFAAALGRFRRARGLLLRAELDAWMARNGVSAAELERLVREQARLDAAAVVERAEPTPLLAPELVYTREDDEALEAYIKELVSTCWHSVSRP